jgi:hypothetical protein
MRACCVPMVCLVAGGCAHSAPSSATAAPIESAEVVSPTAFSNPAATAEEASARALVERLGRHEYQAATTDFDEKLKAALPPDKLEKTWSQAEGTWGSLVSIEEVQAQPHSKGWGALVACRFDRGVHSLGLFFDPDGKISGFWNSPAIVAANLVIDALGYHHPELADALSDAQLHDAAPTGKLAQAWSDIEATFGAYKGIRGVSDQGSFALVVVAFAHGKPTFNVAVDLRGKVTGFHIVDSR